MPAARARKKGPPRWPRVLLVVLRIFIGTCFLDAALYKVTASHLPLGPALDAFVANDYVPLLQEAIADPPRIFGLRLTFFADFLQHVMLAEGWRTLFATAILAFEAWLGISLVLGLLTRISAVLGALLLIAFGLAKRLWFFSVVGTNWILVFVLLLLAALAAGRYFGLDKRLARRFPAWCS